MFYTVYMFFLYHNSITTLCNGLARNNGYSQQFVDKSRVNADETETYLGEWG